VGRKLSELSDDELTALVRLDTKSQTKMAFRNILDPSKPHMCPDFSQYWFAKYELERRKKATEPSTNSIKLTASDTPGSIAKRLFDAGFRAAARKHHSDIGGDDRSMQRLNEAREYAHQRLK
jgi:hypothetical protein